ncbi:uncharacterized protein LOC110738941 [Chenopodium quinoa]|uniref:uncharacterized protein LOC110738941 n=1 Tax=Chenopodium quinoa TaxID=63459 RepID=UPI000B7706B1|nr:uncharacterized protein LOC110738941 [Chenopodium quinoa]
MKILSWNIFGLGNPRSVRALQDLCWRERPELVFVMETKVDASILNKIRNRCGYSNGLCLSSNGSSGGVGFWWKDVNVDIVSYSLHHFHANVLDVNNTPISRAVGLYGWPEQANKHQTWSLMSKIKLASNLPCIMFGDFNEILNLSEKEGGVVRSERLKDSFREAIDRCALRDLGFKGSIFTWERGNSMSTFVRERLDRFLADESWCSMFSNHEVRNLPILKLDHAPILLTTEKKNSDEGGDTGFKFEQLWL